MALDPKNFTKIVKTKNEALDELNTTKLELIEALHLMDMYTSLTSSRIRDEYEQKMKEFVTKYSKDEQ